MKTQQIAGIVALAAMLAACADATLSAPETRTPPTGAAFDGVGLGSGGRSTASDSTGIAPASSTDGVNGTACESEDGRGGVGLGSGGRTGECTTDPL
jgi:hypothetical protein